MNKFSTKIRQKQSIIPKQILQSSFLELGLDDIEKELENEIQKNPVLIEKNIEDFKDKGYESYGLDNQENYDLFLSNLPEDKNVIDNLISQIDQSEIDKLSKEIAQQIIKQKADYILAFKGNHSGMQAELEAWWHKKEREGLSDEVFSQYSDVSSGHGRIETRTCRQLLIENTWVDKKYQWKV